MPLLSLLFISLLIQGTQCLEKTYTECKLMPGDDIYDYPIAGISYAFFEIDASVHGRLISIKLATFCFAVNLPIMSATVVDCQRCVAPQEIEDARRLFDTFQNMSYETIVISWAAFFALLAFATNQCKFRIYKQHDARTLESNSKHESVNIREQYDV